MQQTVWETIESFVCVALAGLLCYSATAAHQYLRPEPYHTSAGNTGIAAWQCGPSVEVWPLPISSKDGVVSVWSPFFMDYGC